MATFFSIFENKKIIKKKLFEAYKICDATPTHPKFFFH